jgi:hypothetical protein
MQRLLLITAIMVLALLCTPTIQAAMPEPTISCKINFLNFNLSGENWRMSAFYMGGYWTAEFPNTTEGLRIGTVNGSLTQNKSLELFGEVKSTYLNGKSFNESQQGHVYKHNGTAYSFASYHANYLDGLGYFDKYSGPCYDLTTAGFANSCLLELREDGGPYIIVLEKENSSDEIYFSDPIQIPMNSSKVENIDGRLVPSLSIDYVEFQEPHKLDIRFQGTNSLGTLYLSIFVGLVAVVLILLYAFRIRRHNPRVG